MYLTCFLSLNISHNVVFREKNISQKPKNQKKFWCFFFLFVFFGLNSVAIVNKHFKSVAKKTL